VLLVNLGQATAEVFLLLFQLADRTLKILNLFTVLASKLVVQLLILNV